MRQTISLQCYCGLIKGQITNARPPFAVRYVCMCDDCQSYAHYLGHPERTLDANGGTELYPVPQAHIQIISGKENLACLKLTPKGTNRWYSACCHTPIANSAGANFPFVGVPHTFMRHDLDGTTAQDALGPIHSRAMGKYGTPPLPPNTAKTISWRAMIQATMFWLFAWFKRQARPSTFYDKTGKPMARPYVLAKAENDIVHSMVSHSP